MRGYSYGTGDEIPKWPVNPTGIKGDYIFNGSTLDWDNMLDDYQSGKYTQTQASAVALLMRQCGAAVEMMYSSYESGAYSENVPPALYTNFGYSKSIAMEWRDYHTQSDWDNIVYTELEAGRPVYYSGSSALGGHAFVCDGYLSKGFFHFNWGWGGYQDGFFMLSALNPASGGTGSYDGGYNRNQMVLTGVKPSSGETVLQMAALATGSFVYKNGSYGIDNDPDGYYMIYNPMNYNLQARFGVSYTPFDGNGSTVYSISSSSTILQPRYGFGALSVTPPNLPAGKYKVRPVFVDQYGVTQPVQVPIGKQEYVTLTVEGGKYTYTNDGPDPERTPELIFGVPDTQTAYYDNVAKTVRVMVSNVSAGDFRDKIGLSLIDTEDPFGDDFSVFSDVILPGNSSAYVEFMAPQQMKPTTYEAYVTTYMGEILCDSFNVEVKPSGQQTSTDGDLQVLSVGPTYHTLSDDGVPVSIAIRNEGKDVIEATVDIRILDSKFSQLKKASLGSVSFEADHLTNLSVHPTQLGLDPGEYFWALDIAGKPAGLLFPLILSGPVTEKDGVFYTVTSAAAHEAMVVTPAMGEYTGKVIIPDAIDGNRIVNLRADAFTFAEDIEEVTLPAGLSMIEPGTFYRASALKRLNVNGATPAVALDKAFAPEAPKGILLSPAKGTANLYAQQPGWQEFKISNWTITASADCEITGGLQVDPMTNTWYAPYYIGADERLAINAEVGATMHIFAQWEFDGKSGEKEFSNVAILPALNGASGTVRLSAKDASGVDDIDAEEWTPCDVYTLDGNCVLRDADRDSFRALPKGLYILRGRKVIL